MPKKNQVTKKRKTTENNYVRKYPDSPGKATICYCPKVCPDVMRVRLRYTEQRNQGQSGVANLDSYVYRANSIFDPNLTGGGHQPLGHDQWSQFYRRYRVIGSKIKVMFSANSTINMVCGVTPLNSSSQLSTSEDYQEATYAKSVNIGADSMHGIGTVETFMPVHQMRGAPPNLVRFEEDYGALFGANPAKEFFWHIWTRSQDGALTWDVSTTVEVTYYVELYDRETLGQS